MAQFFLKKLFARKDLRSIKSFFALSNLPNRFGATEDTRMLEKFFQLA